MSSASRAALVLLLFVGTCGVIAQPLPQVEREFRAAWIATVDNIDFPTKRTLSEAEQRAELIASVELAKRLRLNALIFQVRPAADAVSAISSSSAARTVNRSCSRSCSKKA